MLVCSICIGPFLNLVAILHCSTAPVGLCNTLHLLWGFPDISVGKESGCSAGDPSSIPGWGRSAGEGIGYPLQHSWASLVAQLVKKSACNVGDLGSIPGLGRSWRRQRLPTPVFWPGEFQGLYSPWGCTCCNTS